MHGVKTLKQAPVKGGDGAGACMNHSQGAITRHGLRIVEREALLPFHIRHHLRSGSAAHQNQMHAGSFETEPEITPAGQGPDGRAVLQATAWECAIVAACIPPYKMEEVWCHWTT